MTRYIDPSKIKIIAETSENDGETLVLLADVRNAISMTPSEPVVLMDSPEMAEIIRVKICEFAENLRKKVTWFTSCRADEISFGNVLDQEIGGMK